MSQCECYEKREPRDVIELFTPLYQALGGRLYRLHVTTDARAVLMGDGVSVEMRINSLERSLLANTTTYFADDLAHRDAVAPLTPGDRCYVFDATADPTVPYGGAMYIWLSARQWKKCYNGDSPIDALNMIIPGGGLEETGNKLRVRAADIIAAGRGLAVDELGKLFVTLAPLLAAGRGLALDAQDRLYVRLTDLLGTGGGLAVDAQGRLMVDFSQMPASSLGNLTGDLLKPGGGLATGADGKLTVSAPDLAASGGGLAVDAQGRLKVEPAALIASGGGLATGADGKLRVDFSQMPASQMQAVVRAMVQSGGGIGVDAQGKLYVDFASMPTDKFDAMLKSLRLPIWLTGNKDFYVNKVSGSDSLDEGRGETEAKAFKSIQACVNYVANNYNIGNYRARIVIADGNYEESLTLPSFSRNTGYIELVSQSADRSKVVIINKSIGSAVIGVRGGSWSLRDLTIDLRPNMDSLAGAQVVAFSTIVSSTSSEVNVYGCLMRFAPTGAEPPVLYVTRVLSVGAGGVINVRPAAVRTRIETGHDVYEDNVSVYALGTQTGGQINLMSSNVDGLLPGIESNAVFNVCAHAQGGSIQAETANCLYPPVFSNEARAAGKRYQINSGGSINVWGAGNDFFPGLSAGTVEAASYSWYR